MLALTDYNGNKVVEYVYDSWGKVISTTGSLAGTLGKDNPIRYRGYYYDEETGLYYLQSRYYDPVTCRFINADSQLNIDTGFIGMNSFAYCINNPINMADDQGNCPFWNGVRDFFVNQWEAIKSAFTNPVAAYKNYITNPWNICPGIKAFKNSAETVSNLWQGIGKGISTGNWNDFSYTMGQQTAMTAEVVATMGIAKGISVAANKVMPAVINSKVFSHNDGYGFKAGNFEFLYREPKVGGGAFISYKNLSTKWRIEWDPTHTFHYHVGQGKTGRIHRKLSIFDWDETEK